MHPGQSTPRSWELLLTPLHYKQRSINLHPIHETSIKMQFDHSRCFKITENPSSQSCQRLLTSRAVRLTEISINFRLTTEPNSMIAITEISVKPKPEPKKKNEKFWFGLIYIRKYRHLCPVSRRRVNVDPDIS